MSREGVKYRKFNDEYKSRIVAEVDNCTQPGGLAKIVKREGLTNRHIYYWRARVEDGTIGTGKNPTKEARAPDSLTSTQHQLILMQQRNGQLIRELDAANEYLQLLLSRKA